VTKAVTVSNSTIRLHGPYTPYMGRRGRMVGRFVTMKYVSIVVSSNPRYIDHKSVERCLKWYIYHKSVERCLKWYIYHKSVERCLKWYINI
jgi:hypothetical protein